MKKHLKIFALLLVAGVMLTGCGRSERTLECTGEIDGMTAAINATFRNDELRDLTMTIDMDFSDFAALGPDVLDEIKELFPSACDEFDFEGVTCRTNVANNVGTITVEVDVENASDQALRALDMFGEDLTYEVNRADLEDQGFVCN